MCARRADLGSLGANDDMTAIAALPHLDLALCKDLCHLHVVQQCAVTLLVVTLDRCDQTELFCKLSKALFLSSLCKTIIHIRPLVVFALCRMQQVLCCVADTVELLEPQFCVLALVVCRFEEERCDLLVAFLFCNGRKVGVLVACLRLACKGSLKILFGLRACIRGLVLYAKHLERLQEAGLTYPCFCVRADLHAAQAPHASDGTPIYAGTCKGLTPAEQTERAQTRTPGIRLAVPGTAEPLGTIAFVDDVYGPQREVLAAECGDFLVRRSDGIHAYQLAVTVDDALMGVTRVVRGQDLLSSTARQIYLQRLLGFEQPGYAHVPLLMAGDGSHRLSKRERDCDLGYMRAHFGRPEVLLGRLAHLTGLRPTNEPVSAAELAESFTWDQIRQNRDPIRVPPLFFE